MKRSVVRAVELFAGIGGFRLASETVAAKTIWANEIDPKACAVYRSRFGDNELVEGDIRTRIQDVPPHDLLTAGFPCQPFSNAGKKEGTRDPRGTLFRVIVDVLAAHRPKWFVLENVKRLLSMESGSHFATILDSLAVLDYQVEWRLLNASSFGLAQNRERVIIVGTRADQAREPKVKLASGDELKQLGHAAIRSARHDWRPITDHGQRFATWGLARNGRMFSGDLERDSSHPQPPRLRDVMEKSVSDEFDFTESTVARIKDSALVNRFVHGVQVLSNQGGGARMGYTVFGADGLAPTLTASTSRHYERYKIGNRYRRLTNVEYARLQGFADNHAASATPYDQYSLLGNAVPPPLAAWAIARVMSDGVSLPNSKDIAGQMDLEL